MAPSRHAPLPEVFPSLPSPSFVSLSLPSRSLPSPSLETELAFRGRSLSVPRIVSLPHAWPSHARVRLHATAAGTSGLVVEEQLSLGSLICGAEAELDVATVGLNFRDVLRLLNSYPTCPSAYRSSDDSMPGDDCAGLVVSLGTRVDLASGLACGQAAFGSPGFGCTSGCFASRVRSDARLLVPTPPHVSHEQACSLPTTFSTVAFALRNACLGGRTRMLIHAVAGGVGFVASEAGRLSGWQIGGTVGRPAKSSGLGHGEGEWVVSSRDAAALAYGAGRLLLAHRLQILMSSLSHEMIPASGVYMGHRASWAELGKRGVWSPARVQAATSAVVDVFDMAATARAESDWFQSVLRLLLRRLEAGVVSSLPIQVFDFRKQVSAGLHYIDTGSPAGG